MVMRPAFVSALITELAPDDFFLVQSIFFTNYLKKVGFITP
jgi:hypothetical protein